MAKFVFIISLFAFCVVFVPPTQFADAADKADKKTTAKPKPKRASPMTPIKDDPKLPRVLIIGDSISIGYTLPTRALLKGKANLHRPSTNCGPTTRGLAGINAWLGKGKWDVIHFNWGLHDLKYMNAKGTLVGVGEGKQQVPVDQYEKNLDTLVKRLKKTKAKLIWCATTPVPKGAKGRVPGDVEIYNQAAARVMKKNGVVINDLYAFATPQLSKIQRRADVHYTPDGSKVLAKRVAEVVTKALSE